jgi:hypothetical protein
MAGDVPMSELDSRLVRLGVVDDTNLAAILVLCQAHARNMIVKSPALRFHAAAIGGGSTSRLCACCAGELVLEAG